MRKGTSTGWHNSLPYMSSFNKTEAATPPCRLYVLVTFAFSQNNPLEPFCSVWNILSLNIYWFNLVKSAKHVSTLWFYHLGQTFCHLGKRDNVQVCTCRGLGAKLVLLVIYNMILVFHQTLDVYLRPTFYKSL